MQKYSEFRPSAFDPAGLGLDDRQDWFVLPVMRTRDSEVLTESNFHSALEIMGGESDTVEVHRFGHWGPGWFEIIIIHPSRASEGEKMEDALEDYPVLDEDDYCEREYEAACERWKWMGTRERMELCVKEGVSFLAARRDEPPSEVLDRLSCD